MFIFRNSVYLSYAIGGIESQQSFCFPIRSDYLTGDRLMKRHSFPVAREFLGSSGNTGGLQGRCCPDGSVTTRSLFFITTQQSGKDTASLLARTPQGGACSCASVSVCPSSTSPVAPHSRPPLAPPRTIDPPYTDPVPPRKPSGQRWALWRPRGRLRRAAAHGEKVLWRVFLARPGASPAAAPVPWRVMRDAAAADRRGGRPSFISIINGL